MKYLLYLSILLPLVSCAQNAKVQNHIDAAQTEQMLKADPNIQLVDLRTPAELQTTGKIAGAKAINYNSPDFKSQIGQLDKEKPVIIYCAAGGRSGKALPQLQQMGFKQVYEYSGGINDWLGKGKATER